MTPLAKTITQTLAAIGLAGAAVSPALADTAERKTIAVKTSDVDLGTPQGQKIMEQRVEKAARTVCRATNFTTGTRLMNHETRACMAKARRDAKQRIAALTLEQQRGG